MAWTPTLYTASRPLIVRNLLAWIRDTENDGARQAEALAWAKSQLGFAGTVPNFVRVLNSSGGRDKREFPLLGLVRRRTSVAEAEDADALSVTHTLRFGMWVTDADPDTLAEKVEVYSLAASSMVWACPMATLLEDVPAAGEPSVTVTELDADETRGSAYIQLPSIEVAVRLWEAYS